MKNKTIIILAFLVIFVLSACGEKAATPTAESVAPVSATPESDRCSEENLPGEVSKINDLMREFDDYSRLASSTPQDKLLQVIPPMQEVRRRAETQEVPECLRDLKVLQINHMNTVIEILMVFMANAQSEGVSQGIAQARDLHMKYDIEIARLLGLTLVAPPTGEAIVPLPAATTPPGSATQSSGLSVLNPGPNEVTLRSAPDFASGGVATLAAGLTTVAFGRTTDGLWIQVEVPGQPGQKAWVDASLVQVSGELPVVTP
jgi:hypothetical protein